MNRLTLTLVLAFSLLPLSRASQHAAGNYVVTLVGNMSPDTVLRQHGLGASKKWTRAIHGFAATLNGNQADKLEADTRVLYIEPDVVVHALSQTVPTGVRRIGCQSNAAWLASSVTPINADIAIIDTGIDLTHPDLYVYANTTFVTGTTTGNDDHGHGTHCAGIAAAKNNTVGVVGVAPGARLWAVKVLSSSGSGYLSWIISGVDYVTQHAAEIEVASMSLGGYGPAESLRLAIQNSVAAGVVYVVAAGNDHMEIYGSDYTLGGDDDSFPASFPECMTVSALTDSDGLSGGIGPTLSYGADDTIASFSNYSLVVDSSKPVYSPGLAIDVAAPGVNIYSTYKGGTYATMSGTSMACPHVAGAVALYVAQYGLTKSAAGVYAVRQALVNAGDAESVWGRNFPNDNSLFDDHYEPLVRVNAAPAAAYPVVTITTPRIVPGQFSAPQVGATANLTATASDAIDGDISANIKWNEYLGTAGVMTTIGTGTTASYTFTTAGDTFIVACVTNSNGLRNSMGVPYIVKPASGSTAPTVAITSPADGSTVASTAVQTFTGTATDAVEGNIASRLAWGSSIDGPLGYGASFTNFLSAGSHVITAVVTNAAGLTGTHSHSVTVTGSAPPPPPANYAPIVSIVQPANGLSVPAGTSVTCVGTASDAEDGDLSANIVWSDNVSGGLGKGASATYTPAAGTHTITAQVADSAGAVSSDTHTLTVTSAGTPFTVTVAANKAAYVNKEKAYITTTVRQGAVAVSGATVTVQVRSGSRSVTTKTGTTTSAGTFAFYLPIQKSKYGSGAGPFTATVTANAAKTGYVSGTGSTTYLVY